MKTKHGIFILLLVSIPAWTQNPCGEGGAYVTECVAPFNTRMNELGDNYASDVAGCADFMNDPTYWEDMYESYQKPSRGVLGPLLTMNGALQCLQEANADLDRQIRWLGDDYENCLGRLGC